MGVDGCFFFSPPRTRDFTTYPPKKTVSYSAHETQVPNGFVYRALNVAGCMPLIRCEFVRWSGARSYQVVVTESAPHRGIQ